MFVDGAISNSLMLQMQEETTTSDGAILTFTGKVRADKTGGKEVCSIEFTAQKQIAEQVSETLIRKCIDKFGITGAEVRHSLGNIAAGETCFFVLVKSAHRKEAYRALPWLVDNIKSKCPIFGKEIFSGGDYKWKENN